MERRNAWKIYTADQLKELDQINSRYKVCLDEGKTERECVRLTVKEIEKKGYRNLKDIKGSLKAGNSEETITAAIIQCLPYVGFPNTIAALKTLKTTLEEIKK